MRVGSVYRHCFSWGLCTDVVRALCRCIGSSISGLEIDMLLLCLSLGLDSIEAFNVSLLKPSLSPAIAPFVLISMFGYVISGLHFFITGLSYSILYLPQA